MAGALIFLFAVAASCIGWALFWVAAENDEDAGPAERWSDSQRAAAVVAAVAVAMFGLALAFAAGMMS